jgi:hypothetical protein
VQRAKQAGVCGERYVNKENIAQKQQNKDSGRDLLIVDEVSLTPLYSGSQLSLTGRLTYLG